MNTHENDKLLHFLVVDDDAESRSTIVEYLRTMGFNRITLAHDGTDAIRLLDREPTINFIISDWDMPLMNGLTLLQRVKANPDRAQIPVLVVTSPVSTEAEKVVLAAENMVDGYLIKPFRGQLLQEKIQRILTLSTLGPNKQVAIVDDDPDSRKMVEEYAKQLGFKNVISFEEGESALEYIQAAPDKVGLIISDWEMPKLNGIELLRVCKSQANIADIPFLIITSQSSIERMKIMQAARANVDQYLLKPFSSSEFKKRVDDALERVRTQGELKALVSAGNEHLESGRFNQALMQFEEAVRLNPDHEMALRGLGDVTAKLKGVQAALPFYKKLVEVNPTQARHYIKLAQAYEHLGWVDRGVALMETANRQVGFNADLHFMLGKFYYKKNQMSQAKAEFEKALEIQVDHQESKLMLQTIEGGLKK